MKLTTRVKTSSKWQMGMVGGIGWVVAQPIFSKLGLAIPEDMFNDILITIWGLVGAQTVVDFAEKWKSNGTNVD